MAGHAVRRGLWTSILTLTSLPCFGQSAQPTGEALQHTMLIQTALARGTVFSIDVDNREYWITAKHMFTGARQPVGEITEHTVKVALLNPGSEAQQWLPQTFTVIDPGKDIDIVVLAAEKIILPITSHLNAGNVGVPIGGDCTFLGFPYGGGWKTLVQGAGGKSEPEWFPYVKHCTVSGQLHDDASPLDKNSGGVIWVLDGINNEGFSGGPVLMNTGTAQQVFAVISGYKTEPSEVLTVPAPIPIPAGVKMKKQKSRDEMLSSSATIEFDGKEYVRVNSGFVIAYDINYALAAIRKNPIGPLRPTP
jgi:hypothetical protein